MKIDTFKCNYKIEHSRGIYPVYSSDGQINYYNYEPNDDILNVQYRDGTFKMGPNHKITIAGNVKNAAFGLAVLISDNLQGNDPIFETMFEIDSSIGILSARLEASEEISAFIKEFNKVWKSVLLLG
jgi:hypothetical protein